MSEAISEPSQVVLLTGSEGALGVHLGRHLREHGYRVRGLDLRAGTVEGEHVVADLLDLDAVRTAMTGINAIVHAGAIPWDREDSSRVVSTNVVGTFNALQAAVEAGVERFVGLSSINAQGSSGGWRETAYLPIDDDYPHHPMTPYQLSKHLMEEACRSFSERYPLVTICLRPVFVVHPANPNLDGLGTAAFVEPWRDEYWAYVDVRDVADAVVRSLQVQGLRHDRFLLSARDTSVPDETRALVAREYPGVPWPTVDPERYFAGDPFRSLIDCSHAHEVLGWQPRHSWRDAAPPDTGR